MTFVGLYESCVSKNQVEYFCGLLLVTFCHQGQCLSDREPGECPVGMSKSFVYLTLKYKSNLRCLICQYGDFQTVKVTAELYLFICQCLCTILFHLPRAQPPQGVFEKLCAAAGIVTGLFHATAINQGSSTVDQVLVQAQTVLVSNLEGNQSISVELFCMTS